MKTLEISNYVFCKSHDTILHEWSIFIGNPSDRNNYEKFYCANIGKYKRKENSISSSSTKAQASER